MPKIRKRRQKRRDEVPFSRVRKPIPRPGGPMKDKKAYTRKKKHKKKWEGSD